MSERLKSTNQYSNDEIVEDLTKKFKTTLNAEGIGEYVIEPSGIEDEDDLPTSYGDAPTPAGTSFTDIPLPKSEPESNVDDKYDEYEEDDEEMKKHDKDPDKEKSDSDSDEIDEESLKDTEVTLTVDQKAERQIIAEELKAAGNAAFKVGEYERSIEKYTEGLRICPLQFSQQRAILYCNRSAAKMKLEKYSRAVKDCSRAVALDDKYVKAYHRRAQSLEAIDKLDESLADFQKVLELDPSNKEALKAVIRLPPLIEEKNEKLKTEMMGKLKDIGNMILKPFGLSTDSFQFEQNPETKGYTINFKQ